MVAGATLNDDTNTSIDVFVAKYTDNGTSASNGWALHGDGNLDVAAVASATP